MFGEPLRKSRTLASERVVYAAFVTDPTRRFTDRAQAYARHRPAYPPGVLDVLSQDAGVAAGGTIADVGSGTGILTAMLLDAGYRVFAIEPNAAMRAPAEAALGRRHGFVSIDGRAEATGLDARSVDAVIAAQAFHWFDPPRARAEFERILRPGGAIVLVWNERNHDASPVMHGYQEIVRRFSIDPIGLKPHDDRGVIAAFYGPSGFKERVLSYADVLDREALLGRASSASYLPGADHPDRAAMMSELSALFDRCQERGTVRFEFETHVYWGFVSAEKSSQ